VGFITKDFAGELFITRYFNDEGGRSSQFTRRAKMAWKAPKIVEVPCGMEINMYVSATRK
jgi:coenzyme PQQ precursor peptide PqqA